MANHLVASSLKRTSYHVFLYSLGNILLKLVGLFLLPLYTSVFDIKEYGMIGILETVSLLLTTIISFNLSSALVRWLSDENDTTKEKSIVFTIFTLNTIFFTIFLILIFPFLKNISQILLKSELYTNIILLMFVNIYLDIITRIPLNLIRIREKSFLYIISMILKSFFTLGVNIVLLKFTSFGILAVILGSIVGNIAFLVCTSHLFIKNLHCCFLKSEVFSLLKYSFPLIFVSLGTVLLNMGDRFVLEYLKGFGQVGIYTLAFKVSSAVNIFVLQAVNLAVLPIALKSFKTENGRELLKQIFVYLAVLLCSMFLLISLFSLDVLKVFAKSNDFLLANRIIPILLFAYVFEGLKIIYSYHILYVKKTHWIAWLTLGSAFLNIILNFIIIPKYGYMGAAITTLLSALITFIGYRIVALKLIYVNYTNKKVWYMIITALVLFVTHKIFERHDLANIYYSSFILFLFLIFTHLFKIINFKLLFGKILKRSPFRKPYL